jgi:caffeoyl-CoA O-methyltransferase
MLVELTGARRVVEVGTFGGYGSLSMAEGLPEDGSLITCDIDPVAAAFARRFFAESPHGKKITLLEGNALNSLKTLAGRFDMAFIDADKENYLNYYEALLPLIRPGGLIVADNVRGSGRVLDPQDDATRAICRFIDAVAKDPRVERVMLTVRDGISLIRKK